MIKGPSHRSVCIFLLLSVLMFSAGPSPVFGENPPPVFSTWEGFEVDKCASIWLIKRFIDQRAVIKFFPKGEQIEEGIPFDTPDAKFRRYHNMSTFGSLLRQYRLQDPKLDRIGEIVYDIEVNIWERKRLPETPVVQDAIVGIIRDSKSNDEVVEKSSRYFDLLYQELSEVEVKP